MNKDKILADIRNCDFHFSAFQMEAIRKILTQENAQESEGEYTFNNINENTKRIVVPGLGTFVLEES